MSNIDEQFVEFIVKSLVSNPDAVEIARTIDEKGVLLELTVDPVDLGRVIGKRGATAQSMRTLLRALGTKNDARYNLKIIDNGEGAPARDERPAPAPRDDSGSDDSSGNDSGDDDSSDEPSEETEEKLVEEEQVEEAPAEEERASSLADETRKELEELDDLEI